MTEKLTDNLLGKEAFLEKPFAHLVFGIANRGLGFTDLAEFASVEDPATFVISQVENHLNQGRIVVFGLENGGVDRNVVGLRKGEGGIQMYMASRHPHKVGSQDHGESEVGTHPRSKIVKDFSLEATFGPGGSAEFRVHGSDPDGKIRPVSFGIDAIAPSRRLTISSAGAQTDQYTYPARHYVINEKILKESRHVRLDARGEVVPVKYEYDYISFNRSYDYPEITFEDQFIRDHQLILAGGVTVRPYSFLSPSGWLAKQ